MGWQLCVGSQTEELRPGRPEGLPHTAAIKTEHRQTAAPYFDGCESNSLGLRNPVAADVSDKPTLGSDLGSRNQAVGRLSGLLGRQFDLGLLRSRNKTGHRGVTGEMGGRVWGCFVAQREPAPSPRSEASYAFFGRSDVFVAAVEQREAASDCEAVVIRQRMQGERTYQLARISSSDAASRCSTAATGDEVFSGGIIYRDQYPAC
ncbi:hypothetical protein PS880_03302 [Pseudomonas fluorescens]|uniref:Uncharacterized protein n=1 Tax=Pseudomonas fluorescens TaxID=294 RepID=A0A5E7LGQ8_PSEFL|nr:hypothetical protein PS880_03302 [Pseudomonas fluorescens]